MPTQLEKLAARRPARPDLCCPNCRGKIVRQLPMANCECQSCGHKGGLQDFAQMVPRDRRQGPSPVDTSDDVGGS